MRYILVIKSFTAFAQSMGKKMDKKTIVLAVICPVLFLSCRGEDGDSERVSGNTSTVLTGYARPGPLYATARPDSMVNNVIWSGNSPLLVVEINDAEQVETGDTLLTGSDPFLAIETERLEMELEFARAMGDTVAADSLRMIIEDPTAFVSVVSPFAGRTELLVSAGGTIEPGDLVAIVKGPPPDSVYVILPADDQIRWPGDIPGCQTTPGGLVCTGIWPGDSVSVQGIYSVEDHFIHEQGLKTFLLTTDSDTLPVTVMENRNGYRVIYSMVPLDSIPISEWN